MPIHCLACGDVKPDVIDIRGKEIFERTLQDLANKNFKKDGVSCQQKITKIKIDNYIRYFCCSRCTFVKNA